MFCLFWINASLRYADGDMVRSWMFGTGRAKAFALCFFSVRLKEKGGRSQATFAWFCMFWMEPASVDFYLRLLYCVLWDSSMCRDCLKVYHPECVGRDDSSVQNGLFWTCGKMIVIGSYAVFLLLLNLPLRKLTSRLD